MQKTTEPIFTQSGTKNVWRMSKQDLFQAGCPICRPTNSVNTLKE